MWDEPSRIFDADDVRKGPGVDEIGEYMARVFPGMVQISVEEPLKYCLRPGGVLNAYELCGLPDPVARSLVRARSAPTLSSLAGMTCVGLCSGILALEREVAVTGLGGCARAIGEWSAASRAIGRPDVGGVEFFETFSRTIIQTRILMAWSVRSLLRAAWFIARRRTGRRLLLLVG